MSNRPLLLEASLPWLISKSVHGRAKRRLNEVENQLMSLGRSWWAAQRALAPESELRMCSKTRAHLTAWVEAQFPMEAEAMARWKIYLSDEVIDDSVRPGWLRLKLDRPYG